MPDQLPSTAYDLSKPWNEFCDRLKAIAKTAEKFNQGYEMEPSSLGHRFIMRALTMGWETAYEHYDLASPKIYEAKGTTKLCGSVSSDARYFEARLNPGDSYILTGLVGEAPFIEVSVYEGKLGFNSASRQVDFVTEDHLGLDHQGKFSLLIGPEIEVGRGIRSTAQSDFVMIRVYAFNWSLLPRPSFELKRMGKAGIERSVCRPVTVETLTSMADYVEFTINLWSGLMSGSRSGKEPNTISSLQGATDLSLPGGQRYASGFFDLREGGTLEIEFEPVDSPYWGIQVSNIWSEALDYEGQGSHLNSQSVMVDEDGKVRITVSQQNISGSRNHMSTEGHSMGNITFRMLRSSASLPVFSTRLKP